MVSLLLGTEKMMRVLKLVTLINFKRERFELGINSDFKCNFMLIVIHILRMNYII